MTNLINVGIIGFGLSGRYFFAPFIVAHPGYNLYAVVSSQTDEVKKFDQYIKIYQSVDSLLADESIDLVVVATPNYTHFEYAQKALLAGKHVIVEKPFTITTAEAEQLIQLSIEKGKILAPFQNRRWDGDFLTVKKIIDEGSLGEIVEFESHFDRYRPAGERVAWKNAPHPGTGTLYDLGPHLIDQALVLFGKPQAIYSDIRKLRKHGAVPDSFEIQLYYDRLKVILKAGVMVCEPGARFTIHGTLGSFIKLGLDVQEGNLKAGILPSDPKLGHDSEAFYGVLHVAKEAEIETTLIKTEDGNYMAYFENIYQCIVNNKELIVRPEQAKDIVGVIEKALQSNAEKRQVQFI